MKYSDISNIGQLGRAIAQSEARSLREEEKLGRKVDNFRKNFSPFRFVGDLLQRSFVGFTVFDVALGLIRGARRCLLGRRK